MAERLSDSRISRFLDTKLVVVLATLGRDGTPLLTPMWFLQDGESLVMWVRGGLEVLAIPAYPGPDAASTRRARVLLVYRNVLP